MFLATNEHEYYLRSRKLFGRHFLASIREDSCSFVAKILFLKSDNPRQQAVESPRIIIRQFIGKVAHDAFPIQKDDRRRARHLISVGDAGVGVARDSVPDAEFSDPAFSTGGAVFDVDSEDAHSLPFVLSRQSVDAWGLFLTRRTPC